MHVGACRAAANADKVEVMAVDHGFRRVVRLELHAPNTDAEQSAVGQTRLVNGKSGAGLVSIVKIDLAAIVARESRIATGITGCGGVIEHADHGLVAGVPVGKQVLVGHVAEPGEFVAVAVLRAADDVGHRLAFGVGFLAVQEETAVRRIEAQAGVRVVKCADVGQIGRTEAAERYRRIPVVVVDIGLGGRIVEPNVMHQIVAGQDLQRGLVNDPLGHESTYSAMRPGNSLSVIQLMVHQNRERAVAIVKSSQPVRNARHVVPTDAVARGQDRGDLHIGLQA